MHCDYKLLELLALRLNYVYPQAQQFECYNALLPTGAIAGDSSSRLGNHAERKLSCRDKIRYICTHGGCALSPGEWESYLGAPLEFLIGRNGMVASLLKDAGAAFKFFLGNAEEPLLNTFASNVADAYLHDLVFDDAPNDGRTERVQLTTKVHLYEMLTRREDDAATIAAAKKLLGELLGWMLGSAQGQDTIDKLVTRPGGHSSTLASESGSLVVAVCQDAPGNVLGLADIDPWECDAAGFGHLFREGSYETNIKVPGGPLIGQVRGAYDLPSPDVQLTEEGKTFSLSPVSRHHAVIRRTDTGWRLYDLGSSNGTVLLRRMKNGSIAHIIVGLGKSNEGFCPQGFSELENEAIVLANMDDALLLRRGTGFAIEGEDEVCLGFGIEKRGRKLEMRPLEGAVILRVLTCA